MNGAMRSTADLAVRCYCAVFHALHHYRSVQRWRLIRNRIFSSANAQYFRAFGSHATVASTCVLVNPKYIAIGDSSTIGERSVLSAWDSYMGKRFSPEIEIGSETSIGADCHLTAIGSIRIGNGVLFGRGVTVTDNSHGRTDVYDALVSPVQRPLISRGPVVIRDHAWICDKATILPGVTVGEGSIVAANAVVTTDVPPRCIVGGNPARVLRTMQPK